jgi:LPXTG-motif cell wall-anchored protein
MAMRRSLVVIALVVPLMAFLVSGASAQTGVDAADVDLATGWVSSDVGLQGELAAHPDLGVVLVGGVGEFPPESPPAWYSADGVTFEEVPFPAPTGDPIAAHDVAANEDGFVAIISDPAFASFSADGRTWEPIDLAGTMPGCAVGVVDEGLSAGDLCYLADVAAGPSGFVILGGKECTAFALYSVDGRTWERSTDFPSNCLPIGAVSTSDGFVALGAPDWIISSPDGATWTTINATGLPDRLGVKGIAAFSAQGETLVLVATKSGPDCDFIAGTWYSSDNGQTWTEGTINPVGDPAPDDAGFQPEDIEVTDYGLIAVGPLVSDPLCNPAIDPGDSGLILVSGDGVTWRQFAPEFNLRNIATTSTGLIGSGTLGIATWAPGRDDLPTTGADNTIALAVGGVALILTGTTALLSRRNPRQL